MSVTEFIIAIMVAIFGSGGMWAFFSHLLDKKSQKTQDIQDIKNSVASLNQEIQKLNDTLNKTHDLAIATARDRLNYLNYEYTEQGFIPQKDLVPYKLMGEAYIENDGNTIVSEEFKVCIDNLEVK